MARGGAAGGEAAAPRALGTRIRSVDGLHFEAASEPIVVLEPEAGWEGGDLPLEPSRGGWILTPVRQLRDPAVFEDDGAAYLLYSGAGEQAIGIARLEWE